MTQISPQISVVIPVYRSEQSLELLVGRLHEVLSALGKTFEIVLVDDCSPDGSWEILKKLKATHPSTLKIARLLRNSGQHNAILCGFSLAGGQIIVTMDDDLQNPPEEVPKLVAAIDQGYDLAIGAYETKQHAAVRNAGGRMIDALLRRMFSLPAGFQLTSFRAVRRAVVDRVCDMGGAFPYITAMLFSHASKYVNVPVRHEPRRFGSSNYNLRRSLRLAANLILNYSSWPLYLIASFCIAALCFAVGYGIYVIIKALTQGTVSGWASMVVLISFFNGVVLLCMAILALYISRINQQITRTRLRYTIGELHE